MNQEERIKELEKRVEELERMWAEHIKICPLFQKPKPSFIKEDVRSYRHKSGQKEGHEGVSRETPEKIDEIKEHKLKKCPICEEPVSKTQEIRERITEDI